MKHLLLAFILITPFSATGQALRLDSLDRLAGKASDSVNVSLDGSLLRIASRFLSDSDSDQVQIKKLVAGLKGVYVRHLEFKTSGQYLDSDIDGIRNQLRDARWKHIVEIRGRDYADVMLRQDGEHITGMAVIAAEPTELTVVYIDGPIDLDGLSHLEGNFGIPENFHMHLERKSK
jgi:hypothetical protein